ncbi:MAG: polysaccharide lyase family protein [Phycisphaerae bacterium]
MRCNKVATAAVVAMVVAGWAVVGRAATGSGGVTVKDEGDKYVLSNGVVTATVSKTDGNLWSLTYRGIDTLQANANHPSGYWSHSAATPDDKRTVARVTIDPATNGGERAEVSVKGSSGGERMGAGPGGSAVADIEIRWTLERGATGVYTYCQWEHKPSYPWTSIGEARFCAKLNDDVFDWMTVDARRNMKMLTAHDWNYGTPMNMKEVRLINTGPWKGRVEHKYDYSANQNDVRAWGWSSTTKHIGIWFINPSIEYLSGGPTKIELSAHRDATFNPNDKTAPAPPCLLNYWRGSHYGGSSAVIGQGEEWKKVIGPFFIYCDGGSASDTPESLWREALSRCSVEEKKWPYGWVNGVDYPHKDERGTASGRIVLEDPIEKKFDHLMVGLAHADYVPPSRPAATQPEGGGRFRRRGGGGFRNFGPTEVTWQNDAKYYQFWAPGDAAGHFSIPNVRPGKYTLHAIADNVLGDFAQADVTVKPGEKLDLGNIVWQPVRYGKQIWAIGEPDRTAGEFRNGKDYYHWGLYNDYATEFPKDVTYVIGKSDPAKDWNLMEVPHREGNTGYKGRETTWTVVFDLKQVPEKSATLRLAFAGWEAPELDVGVNGKEAGKVEGLMNTGAIHRDADRSYWQERDVKIDPKLLKAGENRLTLTVPAGGTTAGVEYDYLRLEGE